MVRSLAKIFKHQVPGYFGDSGAWSLKLKDVNDFDVIGVKERSSVSDNLGNITPTQKESQGT